MNPPSLRVGIIGAGSIVLQRHLPALRRISGVEITAVANSTLASAEAFCAAHAPEARPIERWQDLAALPDLDIVWIGAAPFLHRTTTLAALAAGKHVFCQARMAMDLPEAEEMLTASRARPDLVTMLCPPPHGMRGDIFMRELLQAQTVGEIRNIRLCSLSDAFLDPSKSAHWRQRREVSGLNVLTLGIFTEVLQRWLGDFTVTAVTAQIFVPERDGYRVEIPDALQMLTTFENGAHGVLEFSGAYAGKPVEFLEIGGSAGILRYDFTTDAISCQLHGETSWKSLPIPAEKAVTWTVEQDFIHAVRHPDEPRPHPDFEDGVRYMRIVQQAAKLAAPPSIQGR